MIKFIEWLIKRNIYIDIEFDKNKQPIFYHHNMRLPPQMYVGYLFDYLMERYSNLYENNYIEEMSLVIGENSEEWCEKLIENIEELDK